MEKTRKKFTGTVVSDKMDKTIVVGVENLKKHPMYGKFVRVRKKYMAHDENNECKVGDKVMIEESKPISKNKTWKLVKVVQETED
jgi:small subunit ribosomal protein S17